MFVWYAQNFSILGQTFICGAQKASILCLNKKTLDQTCMCGAQKASILCLNKKTLDQTFNVWTKRIYT